MIDFNLQTYFCKRMKLADKLKIANINLEAIRNTFNLNMTKRFNKKQL